MTALALSMSVLGLGASVLLAGDPAPAAETASAKPKPASLGLVVYPGSGQDAVTRDALKKAWGACLEGRDYSVKKRTPRRSRTRIPPQGLGDFGVEEVPGGWRWRVRPGSTRTIGASFHEPGLDPLAIVHDTRGSLHEGQRVDLDAEADTDHGHLPARVWFAGDREPAGG